MVSRAKRSIRVFKNMAFFIDCWNEGFFFDPDYRDDPDRPPKLCRIATEDADNPVNVDDPVAPCTPNGRRTREIPAAKHTEYQLQKNTLKPQQQQDAPQA